MNPDAADAARQAARDASKQIGQWLEEAIAEKRERENEAGNVTTADC
jgi:cytochrome P450